MDKIRALLVDDEPLALDLMEKKLLEVGGVEIAGRCLNGFEAVKACSILKPDLIFLDIEMPKLSGFDVIELLNKDEMPHVIFVTAYNDYAVQAFEKEAVDYLVKPASPERIQKSLDRIRKIEGQERTELTEKIRGISREKTGPISRILIKNGTEIDIVSVQEIVYIKAEDDYIRIFTKEKSFLKNGRLSNLESQLPGDAFVRLHRSFIINLAFLKKIEPYMKDSKIAILEGKIKIPVSKSGYNKLKERF